MNPPPALYGAMSRDRKPFTYTPGGLDLSEIKSERMAKRLMRNAMNQGVPEVPIQHVQSPPATSMVVPNFNCLPVQVFPTINLPANPKSLLRTRSNPDNPKEPPVPRQPKQTESYKPKADSTQNNSAPSYQRPLSMYEHNDLPKTNYTSNNIMEPLLPEISYEAEYFQTMPRNYMENKQVIDLSNKRGDDLFINHTQHTKSIVDKIVTNENNETGTKAKLVEKLQVENGNQSKQKTEESIKSNDSIENKIESHTTKNKNTELDNITQIEPSSNNSLIDLDFYIEPLVMKDATIESKQLKEESGLYDNQKEVKVVKKQVKKESKTEVQNGEQNGDASVEAELTVKIPAKKSAAKTETKVEVVKKQLPDGSTEEIKTTTTKTTVDGKTKISTKTETTIIPKEEEEEVEVEEEEEEEEEKVEVQEVEENGNSEIVEKEVVQNNKKVDKPNTVQSKDSVVTTEERSETQTTKKVTIVQQQEPEEEEVEEEEEEEEIVETKSAEKPSPPTNQDDDEEDDVEEEEEQVEDNVIEKRQEQTLKTENVQEEQEEEEEEEEEEIEIKEDTKKVEQTVVQNEKTNDEDEETAAKVEVIKKEEVKETIDTKEDEESEYTEEEYESEKEETPKPEPKSEPEAKEPEPVEEKENESRQQATEEKKKEPVPDEKETVTPKAEKPPEPTVPLREPSIPLEKVEDVEIKPISLSGAPLNETITKTITKNTEITTTERPTGPLSTQTEYNRIENIVTVNRTTKTLDHTYEQLTQQGVPTVKTYFAPTRERVSTSPQPSKPYQPVFPPTTNQSTERRHSLLLERLSTERQMPSDIYQNYQSHDHQKLWSQEPQAEVVTVSNVKPSKITNQQWYQNQENVIYNNVTPTTPASQTWSQPSYQSQPSPQPQYQSQPQPQYQSQPQPQPQPQPQYQPSYTETSTNTYQQNNYQTYTPKLTTWGSNLSNTDTQSSSVNNQQNQYSYLNQNSSQSYQKTTQQYSSSYVPPPWEQDASYASEPSNQTYYQAPLPSTFTPNTNQGWNPPPPKSKFSKTPPTSYIPPAPNQSFVKPVNTVEPPKVPGKKTYYSEYERRYITVPESNYVPGETKFQPQPDPSPQYYYDNNEPADTVEPQWRKELREFTEKTSQTQQSEQISVKPPWEEDSLYAKAPTATYTPTPSWSQTLRPRSWRERSFESEYVGSQETQKTSTLGRGRPLSSYGKSQIETIPERPRGVSVDRYNPNNYQSPIPAEHPPVQSHTLNVVPPAKSYHNPNVPAYHSSRASAEPREQPVVYQQPRQHWGESRASPIQSRSFKYLQWITGTDN